jgi:hypothetical protein
LKRLLALFLATLAGTAWAAEPLGFKGITLGSAITRISQDPRFDCRMVPTPTADQICTLRHNEEETIAGVNVIALYYFYDRARLTGITISLPEARFEAVAKALRDKYGAPQVEVETVKNAKGEAFENRTLSWRQGEGLLQAERYAGRLDRSMVRLSDETAAARVRQRRATPAGQDL